MPESNIDEERDYLVYGSLNVIAPHKLIGVALVGGVTLLEWVWPCWRKRVTVGVGFKVF